MNRFCGNCFNESLNDQGICTLCGFNDRANWDKAPHGLPAGTILNGRYIIGKVLGQGGFGITYTAKDHQSGQIVAVKEFFPDSMATRAERTSVIPFSGDRGEGFVYGKECFLREAQTMAEFIGNPNIVRVYSYFEENETAYFVMEYVDGQSLQGYLKSKGGAIALEEALDILYPVMDALSAVHEKGIIHRDIAPDNIYISRDGTVKLLDFGAARYSLGNVSRSLDVILKHGFAPREQYKRRGRQGPYTDVYSMAATLYYAITGNRPDDALERQDEDDMPLPSSLGAKISPQQEDVLLKAMEVDYEKRFQTMAQFRNALKRAKPLQTETKKAPAEKPKAVDVKQPEKKKPETVQKKKPLWLIPAAAALVCILIAAFATGAKESPALSVETTLPPVTEQTVPTVTPDPIPETVPLTDEEKAYNEAVDLFYQGEYGKAAIAFGKLGDFQDAREISFKIWDAIAKRDTIAISNNNHLTGCVAGIKLDGTLCARGKNTYGQCDVKDYTDVIALDMGSGGHAYILKSDHTVTCVEGNGGWKTPDFSKLNDVVSICGYAGLKADGSIVITTSEGQQEYLYQDCIMLEFLGNGDLVALKSDGTVIGLDAAKDWTDIISIKATGTQLFGFKEDGTVLQTKNNYDRAAVFSAEELENVISVASGQGQQHILALKSDGTVIAKGDNISHQCDVEDWTDIIAVYAEDCVSIGLKSDGTVVHAGSTDYGFGMISKWTDMKLPADRDALLAAIELHYITK